MNTIKNTIYIPLVAGCCLVCAVATAQVVTAGNRKIADGYYAKGDYYAAAQYYEKYVAGGNAGGNEPYVVRKQPGGSSAVKAEKEADILYKLADSYRQLNDYKQAEGWYKKLMDDYADLYPVTTRLYYAICLRANGKYEAAQQQLERFLQQYKSKDKLFQQATIELNNCTFIRQQLGKKDNTMTAQRLTAEVNKQGASYAAGWLNEQTLLFTSTRADSNIARPAYINTLYSSPLSGDQYGEAVKLALPGAGLQHQGAAAITPDGKTLFFTSWIGMQDDKKKAAIFTSTQTGNSWSEPVKLGNTINAEGYNSRQPFITTDGKYLLFASDKPGGKGGFDIWYAPLKGVIPGRAVNAGETINTKEDEEGPFYHAGDKQLVFASKGRTGMGGFDLFTAKGEPGSVWEVPQNMGYPVNSIKDDIYFTAKGGHLFDHALISSDRASACCLELFAIRVATENPPVAVASPQPVTPVPVPEPAALVTTTPIPVDTAGISVFAVHLVQFGFNEARINPSFYGYLDELAAYLKAHPAVRIEIGAHTDGKGEEAYNLKLSTARAASCADYLIKTGVAANRITSKGYGACCPLVKETTATGKDDEAARSRNRRVEVKVIP